MIRVLSTAFGLLMIVATGMESRHGPGFVAALLALAAVAVGVVFRPAATAAVLCAVAAVALNRPAPMLAAVSGLAASLFLVLRHAAGRLATVTTPTIVATLAFTVVGLAATSFPLRLAWLPLVAPPAVLAIYLLATRPYLRDLE